jgi:CheY-like chemotaxis protein
LRWRKPLDWLLSWDDPSKGLTPKDEPSKKCPLPAGKTFAGVLEQWALVMLSPFSTVLVVDDNPMARATAVHLFQDFGFEVLDAYNGATAMRLIEAHPEIGLLFVDVRMPGMSGLELATAAQTVRPQLRIVFTSGYVDRRDIPGDAPFVA